MLPKAFFVATIPLLLCSCIIERRLYTATQVINPAIQKTGDYSLATAYSAPAGVDVTGGFAITNHIAIIGGYNNYNNKDEEEEYSIITSNYDSAVLNYRHKGFTVGAGSYFPISNDKESIFLSFFGGIVKNKFSMHEALYAGTSNPATTPKLNYFKSDINRWFLQGGINFYPESFQISFATRFNHVSYDNVITDYTINEQFSYNLPPTQYPRISNFLDLSFDVKYFLNKSQTIGLQTFFIATSRLNRKEHNFYYYPFRTGFGLVLKRPIAKKMLNKPDLN